LAKTLSHTQVIRLNIDFSFLHSKQHTTHTLQLRKDDGFKNHSYVLRYKLPWSWIQTHTYNSGEVLLLYLHYGIHIRNGGFLFPKEYIIDELIVVLSGVLIGCHVLQVVSVIA